MWSTSPLLAIVLATALAVLAGAEGVAMPGPDAGRVVVLRNLESPVSCAVADDYAARRGAHRLDIRCQDSATGSGRETIAYAEVQRAIEGPLREWLAAHPGVDIIVLTKGIPLRISDAPGLGLYDKRPSLDSWLAALGYGDQPGVVPVRIVDSGFTGNAWSNRFWQSEERFAHARHGGYLVSRLDGWTQADAIALTTRALAAEGTPPPPGAAVLLDACPAFGFGDPAAQPRSIVGAPAAPGERVLVVELDFKDWNADLVRAGGLLAAAGIPAEVDRGEVFAGGRDGGLLGYASWGSNDRNYRPEAYRSLRFVSGALVETAVSTSARTFLPTEGGQSLIADLIAQGATGAKGYTDEPLLQAIASPSVLFDRYLVRGWTLAESYAAASRFVAWEDIVVGDPLCRVGGRPGGPH